MTPSTAPPLCSAGPHLGQLPGNTLYKRNSTRCTESPGVTLNWRVAVTMASSPKAIEESAARPADPAAVIQETPKRRWVSYIWDTFDKSPEERRLLTKLDAAVLTFASLGGDSSRVGCADIANKRKDTSSSILIKLI